MLDPRHHPGVDVAGEDDGSVRRCRNKAAGAHLARPGVEAERIRCVLSFRSDVVIRWVLVGELHRLACTNRKDLRLEDEAVLFMTVVVRAAGAPSLLPVVMAVLLYGTSDLSITHIRFRSTPVAGPAHKTCPDPSLTGGSLEDSTCEQADSQDEQKTANKPTVGRFRNPT
jgi:hypothetical protein